MSILRESPQLGSNVFVAPSANVIGKVQVRAPRGSCRAARWLG